MTLLSVALSLQNPNFQCRLFYEEFKSDQYELVAKKEINRLKEEK